MSETNTDQLIVKYWLERAYRITWGVLGIEPGRISDSTYPRIGVAIRQYLNGDAPDYPLLLVVNEAEEWARDRKNLEEQPSLNAARYLLAQDAAAAWGYLAAGDADAAVKLAQSVCERVRTLALTPVSASVEENNRGRSDSDRMVR